MLRSNVMAADVFIYRKMAGQKGGVQLLLTKQMH